jgi:hypothetical protein
MNIDYVHTLRDMVSRQAVDMRWRTIPQLQIPLVEYVVPSGEDADKVLADMQRRLSVINPNVGVKLVVKGAQIRVRVEYRT